MGRQRSQPDSVHRIEQETSGVAGHKCDGARRLEANYRIFGRAIRSRSELHTHGRTRVIELVVDQAARAGGPGCVKKVAALPTATRGGRSQKVIDQTAGCNGGSTGRCAAQDSECSGEANRRISIPVGNLRGVDGTYRSRRRRVVCGHAGAQQVWDRDGRNDQDNGHHNQKLDERKTLLL